MRRVAKEGGEGGVEGSRSGKGGIVRGVAKEGGEGGVTRED